MYHGKEERLPTLPNDTTDDIRELREMAQNTLQQQIESAIDKVGSNNEIHVGTRDKICQQCFRCKPQATKKCGDCRSVEF